MENVFFFVPERFFSFPLVTVILFHTLFIITSRSRFFVNYYVYLEYTNRKNIPIPVSKSLTVKNQPANLVTLLQIR